MSERSTAATNERLGWTAAIIVAASLPHWLATPAWIPALLLACVGWRFAAAVTVWPLPGRPIRLVLAVGAFAAVLTQFGTVNGVTAGSALLIVMVALKFLETTTQRDHIVLIIIAYFLAFASLLYNNSLLAGGYIVGFVWLTTVGLLKLGRGGPALATWPTAKLAGRLLLKALPVMLILFVLFPRLPGPLWALPGDTRSGATGLSDTMSPGDITELGRSDEVAFRVEFLGTPPRQEDLYWRGPVLTRFDGRVWSRGADMRPGSTQTIDYLGERTEYRVTLEPGSTRHAFAIDMPERWEGGRHRIVMARDYSLRLFMPESRTERVAYEAISHARYRAREPLSERERDYYMCLPEGFNPRTRELVARWREAGLSREAIVERALSMFREDEFFYTLSPPALGRHTADEFIFETREGFCEHYASAFTIMMRAAGIPARVVTGYQGGERNRLGDYYIVRQADAHAWTELRVEGEGWVRVDPTAAVAAERITLGSAGAAATGGLERGGGIGFDLTRELVLAWDAVNMYWDRFVLGYGPRLQRALLEFLGFARPSARHLIVLAVLALTLVAAAFALASMRARRPRASSDAAARELERFVARLARAGVERRGPGETPTAYAERARRALPASAEQIEAVTRAYLRARYEPDATADDVAALAHAVRSLKPAETATPPLFGVGGYG